MIFELLARHRLRIGYLYILFLFIFMNPSHLCWGIGGVIMMLGEFLRTWASGYIYKDQELAVDGPYSLVRNPLYLGTFFIGLGATVISCRSLLLLLYPFLFLATYLPLIQQEEIRLSEKFGEAALAYMRRVPRLLPSLRTYLPPNKPWNLERTIFYHYEWLNWLLVGLYIAWAWWRIE